MAEEDTKVFHYGESVIMAGGDRHFEGVVIAAFRDRSSGKWRYWSKATVVSNRHSRRRNCFAGEHKPLLRIDGPVAIAGGPRADNWGSRREVRRSGGTRPALLARRYDHAVARAHILGLGADLCENRLCWIPREILISV